MAYDVESDICFVIELSLSLFVDSSFFPKPFLGLMISGYDLCFINHNIQQVMSPNRHLYCLYAEVTNSLAKILMLENSFFLYGYPDLFVFLFKLIRQNDISQNYYHAYMYYMFPFKENHLFLYPILWSACVCDYPEVNRFTLYSWGSISWPAIFIRHSIPLILLLLLNL